MHSLLCYLEGLKSPTSHTQLAALGHARESHIHNSAKQLKFTTLYCLHITMAENLQMVETGQSQAHEKKKKGSRSNTPVQSETVQRVCQQLGLGLSDLSGYVQGFPGCYVRIETEKINERNSGSLA